ncbi:MULTISPECIES: aminotransferase class IV [Niastella]|uniref:branched-chain-amino-acid transaminase n=1 Tax=Niastella soli TaxID=2821487 RepID=A0ABS3YUC0_9BACT|nr:aminotransferase class IV [Niastella soli]MBO9201480.1 aminotransferase class IV [Niastella soli]
MNNWLFYNGKVIPAETPIIAAGNRGLRFGDGLFETIKVVKNEMPLFPLHMERLNRGLTILGMQLPADYTAQYIIRVILELCKRNAITGAARIRLSVFRGNGTLFTTEDQYASIIIQAEPLASDYLLLNETGLTIDVCPGVQKSCDQLSNLKSNNYLPYVIAAQYARQHQLNDCLVLNTHNRICDGTIANVFRVHQNNIYTPPLSEGGVAGVMRQYLLNELSKGGYTIHEKICTPEELEAANEVFLTNALYGIRWVKQFRNKIYSNNLVTILYRQFIGF